MRRLTYILILCTISILFLFPESSLLAEKSLPTYIVRRTTSVITVDGLMNEPDWLKAKEFGNFSFAGLVNNEEREGTSVKMLWNDKNLYVFFHCEDSYIQAEQTERDDDVSRDDCVEVFISPNYREVSVYFNFEINAKGTVLDHARIYKGGSWLVLTKWDADVRVKEFIKGTLNNSQDTDCYWNAEISIPFRNFARISGTPKNGDIWRLNLNRVNRLKNGKYQYSQWSITNSKKATFHVPNKFGFIYFSDL